MKKEIDIKGGKLTFGQRIELGKIAQSGVSDSEIFEQIIFLLYKIKPRPRQYKKYISYFNHAIEGLKFWIEQEKLLNYECSPEERAAGIKEFTSKVGEFATIKALAKAYAKDPDEILEWEYGKVFGILYTDLEEYKFNQRYNKILQAKYK